MRESERVKPFRENINKKLRKSRVDAVGKMKRSPSADLYAKLTKDAVIFAKKSYFLLLSC